MSIATWNDSTCEILATQLFRLLADGDLSSSHKDEVFILIDAIEEAGAERTAARSRDRYEEGASLKCILLAICCECRLARPAIREILCDLRAEVQTAENAWTEDYDPADFEEAFRLQQQVNDLVAVLMGEYRIF